MNFDEYLNSLDLANLNDLQPNEGMEMGWYKCKEEVLKILKNRAQYRNNGNGGGSEFIHIIAIKDIEKL